MRSFSNREAAKTNRFFKAFNSAFDKLAKGYAASVKVMAAKWVLVMGVFAGLCVLTVFLFGAIPGGFVPEEDQGYFIGAGGAARRGHHRAHPGRD